MAINTAMDMGQIRKNLGGKRKPIDCQLIYKILNQ